MTPYRVWPWWLSVLYSVWRRFGARLAEVGQSKLSQSDDLESCPGTQVPLDKVLRILLEHELSKSGAQLQPEHNRDPAPGNEATLSALLQQAGWPARRVRRISGLTWHQSCLTGEELRSVQLAPVPWVVRLGRGSTRAEDVAAGARLAMRSGTIEPEHLASIRLAMEEPPHPRVLVLRSQGGQPVVEDGNHFVIATLLNLPDAVLPSVPCFIGATRCASSPKNASCVVDAQKA